MNEENITQNKQRPVALITGAARRIGAEIVRSLHQNNYQVIIHCHRSVEEANLLASTLNITRPNSAYVICTDISAQEGCKQLIEKAVAIKGRLDALINNASVFFPTAVNDHFM